MVEITDHFTGDIRSPHKGQIIYRDDNLVGFGLRVTASQRAYIAECKVNGKARRGSHSAGMAPFLPMRLRSRRQTLIEQMSARRLPSKRSTQAPTLKELLALCAGPKALPEPTTVLQLQESVSMTLPCGLVMDEAHHHGAKEMEHDQHKDLAKTNHMGTMGHHQANAAMHVLSRMLNYAADNLQSPDGQPLLITNPVRKLPSVTTMGETVWIRNLM